MIPRFRKLGAGLCLFLCACAREPAPTTPPPSPDMLGPALSVLKIGDGYVSSDPPGIDCGPRCAAVFPIGARVILSASGVDGGPLSGWSGDCSGTGPCAIWIDGARPRSATASFAPPGPPRLGWAWDNPIPQGNPLLGLFGDGAGQVLAVGAYGAVVRAQGGAFAALDAPSREDLNAVWAARSGEVFVGGARGVILRLDGAGFRPLNSGTSRPIRALTGSGPNEVYALARSDYTADEQILRWNGAAWSAVPLSGTPAWIYGGVPGEVFVGRTNGFTDPDVLRSNDGKTWQEVAGLRAVAMWGQGPGDLFALQLRGVQRWDGKAWSTMTLPMLPYSSYFLRHIWGRGPTDVYITGFGTWLNSAFFVLHYDGNPDLAWTLHSSLTSALTDSLLIGGDARELYVLTGRDPTASAPAPAPLRWTGAAWQSVVSGDRTDLFALAAAGPEVYALGDRKLLRGGEDGWVDLTGSLPKNLPGTLSAIWASAPGDLWGVGWSSSAGRFALHLSGGTWRSLIRRPWPGADKPPLGVWASRAPSQVYALDPQGVYRWDPVAESWDFVFAMSEPRGIWGSGPTDIFVVGLKGAVARYDGAGWTALASGTDRDLLAVGGSGPKEVFAVGASGTILRWDGARLGAMASGVAQDLASVASAGPGAAYAVAPPPRFASTGSAVVRWDGAAWRPSPPPAPNVTAVQAAGPGRVYFVGRAGTIVHTVP